MRSLARRSVGLALGCVLLSGCSAIGDVLPGTAPTTAPTAASTTAGATGQSVGEACAALGSTLIGAAGKLESAFSDLDGHPARAMKKFTAFTNSLRAALKKVDNAQVKAQGRLTLNALDKLIRTVEKATTNPARATAVEGAFNDVRSQVTAMVVLCAAG